jgi:hypothetical protein
VLFSGITGGITWGRFFVHGENEVEPEKKEDTIMKVSGRNS